MCLTNSAIEKIFRALFIGGIAIYGLTPRNCTLVKFLRRLIMLCGMTNHRDAIALLQHRLFMDHAPEIMRVMCHALTPKDDDRVITLMRLIIQHMAGNIDPAHLDAMHAAAAALHSAQ
jgi:hypothetical protein